MDLVGACSFVLPAASLCGGAMVAKAKFKAESVRASRATKRALSLELLQKTGV